MKNEFWPSFCTFLYLFINIHFFPMLLNFWFIFW